jgi:hypothetical protein
MSILKNECNESGKSNIAHAQISCLSISCAYNYIFATLHTMKRLFIQAAKIGLVLILLLKLTVALDFPVGSSINFAIESECETESSEENSEEGSDVFFHPTTFRWAESDYSILLVYRYYLTSFAEEHTREIVPPPPQV